MEYETKGTDFSLGEFYKAYKEKLPTVVMVTQGFCGEILAETLDYGLVLRLDRTFSQRRVIAVRLNDHGAEESAYSFPVDYPVKFCLDEGPYQTGHTLSEILDQRKLPVNVQFARKQFIKVGNSMSSTSHFSTLRLTYVFDEIYLLGNLVSGYELDPQIVQIPLYLSAVKFSEVIGLKGTNKSDWKQLQNKFDYAATQMDFDAFSGNPEIAKYKSNYLSKLVSKENVVNDLIHENFEPQTYTNVKELLASVRSSELETADDNNEYEPIEQRSSENRKDNEKGKKSVQKPTAEDTKDQDQSNKYHKTLFGDLKDRLKKVRNPVEKTDASSQPPKISPKPKVNMNASESILQGQNREPNLSSDTFEDSPPPVPPRLLSGPPTELDNMKTIPLRHEDSYENIKCRAEVHLMPNLQPGSTPLNAEIPVRVGLTGIQNLKLQQTIDLSISFSDQNNMEYETKGTDYSLGEFYKAYKENLPTVVMVTQGFCGEILAETLDYGLVLRLDRTFSQRRVIAVRLNDHGTEESAYSFPVDYPVKFCLDEGPYQTEGHTLSEILDQRKLPVNVQFARKQFIKVGNSMSSTSHFSTLRLTYVFDEIYLLGNLVSGYELDPQIVQIPLYLSAVKFSEVIGLKGKNKSDWKQLQNKLDYAATQMDFDAFSGNPEIAKYKSNYLSKLVSKENVVHDLMYENFEPQTYTNVKELLASVRSSELETADDNNEYEPIEQCSSPDRKDNEKGKKSVHKPTAEDTKDQDESNHKTLFGELKARLKKVHNPVEKTASSSQPPRISPKPKVNINASEGQNREPKLSGDTFDNSPPPVPPRLPSGPPTELDNMKTIPVRHEDSYENIKYRAEVHPMPNLQLGSTTLNAEIPVRDGLTGIQTLNIQQVNDRDNARTINVKVLKVDDLGRWMAEKLRLGKHVERFAEELVDGATLLDLDEDLLKKEFGFSPIEAKRLMKFAKEGHVPQ